MVVAALSIFFFFKISKETITLKNFAFAAVVSAIIGLSTLVASADAMHSTMMMPKCSSGDSAVGVNTMTKTYMTHDQMKMKTAGMSDSQIHAMMMKNHMKMMCMSQAKQMGATMMHSKM